MAHATNGVQRHSTGYGAGRIQPLHPHPDRAQGSDAGFTAYQWRIPHRRRSRFSKRAGSGPAPEGHAGRCADGAAAGSRLPTVKRCGLRRACVTLCGLGVLALSIPAAFADAAPALIKSLQLVAAPAPVRQRRDWRVPHKVLLLEFGTQDWAAHQAQFVSAAPHTQVVVVHNMTEALAQAKGT